MFPVLKRADGGELQEDLEKEVQVISKTASQQQQQQQQQQHQQQSPTESHDKESTDREGSPDPGQFNILHKYCLVYSHGALWLNIPFFLQIRSSLGCRDKCEISTMKNNQ
jgi:hypothetical protein